MNSNPIFKQAYESSYIDPKSIKVKFKDIIG